MLWTEENIEFLKKNYMNMTYSEIGKILGRNGTAVKSKACKLGLLKVEQFSADEIEYIKTFYPHVKTEIIAKKLNRSIYSIYNKALVLNLKKTDIFLKSEQSGMFTKGHTKGKQFQYKKGHVPANKGKKIPEEIKCKMAHTFFKKGHKPHNTDPLHTIKTKKDNKGVHYFVIKLGDCNWEYLQRWIWTQKVGEIPKGYNVIFKDGDQSNIDLNNLELVSNADLMRRNMLHNYPKELAQLIQMKGALVRQINQIINKENE